MAQLLVRGVEPEVLDKIREQAQRNGRSLEAEARDILRRASQTAALTTEVERVQALFAGRSFSDSGALQAEDREDHGR